MKEVMRQSMIKDIGRSIEILSDEKTETAERLKKLSEHIIEDVALYRNVDAATLAILIYSIYKTTNCISCEKQEKIIKGLSLLQKNLQNKSYTKYNISLKILFELLKDCNSQIQKHVHDVFYAAKIKKGSDLLEQGLSLARAADLMGISRWDALHYGASAVKQSIHSESWPAAKRLKLARKVFLSGRENYVLFDAGPIITLALSQLLWILKPLKEKTEMTFYITPAVYSELVEKPQKIKRFQFEALHVQKLIREGILTLYKKPISKKKSNMLTSLANNSFSIKEGPLEILQAGELETLTLAIEKSSAMILDERTLRLLIEKPTGMRKLLEHRKRKRVKKNPDNLREFKKNVGKPKIIRSVEIVAIAFEKGILNEFLIDSSEKSKRELLSAVLWNTKYHGASVIDHEIEEIMEEVFR